MTPRKLSFHQFMAYEQATVTFPDRGLVLVTGDNGEGKSCLIEGYAVACWGKTLRGTPPWWDELPGRGDEPVRGHVQLDTVGGLTINRARQGGKSLLTWANTGAPPTQYATTTKAQDGLDPLVGSLEVWRRTSVFSSADAHHFSAATDAERKRFLEELLGLGMFDVALRRCRDDLRAAQAEQLQVDRMVELLEERLRGARQRQTDARVVLAQMDQWVQGEDEAVLAARHERLMGLLRDCGTEMNQLQSQLRQVVHGDGAREAAVHALEAQLHQLRGGTCKLCGQGVSEDLRAGIRGRIEDERAVLGVARAKADADRVVLEERLGELQEERTELERQRMAVIGKQKHAADMARGRLAQARVLEEATAVVDKTLTDLGLAQVRAAGAKKVVGELRATEQVLGLQGVRVQVLTDALRGLEVVANNWLGRIAGPHLRLRLRTYTEGKDGKVADKLALDVSGAGGGYGYRGASGGQRRRIDVALLFALAEVSQAAAGATAGALWFDEVFDTLDEGGASTVAEALADLAEDRLVIVISHSALLKRHLRPGLHLHVAGGTVAEVV